MSGMSGMGGISSPNGGQALHVANLLPGGVRAAAVLVYLAILAAHVLHVRHTSGQRRLWQVGHVAMAIGMIYMWSPAGVGAGAGVGVGAGAAAGAGAGAGAFSSAATATATASATATLACERDLRLSLSAMTLGMAYMILAMLVMR